MSHSQSPWQRCIPELLSMMYREGSPLTWPHDITFAPLRVCSSWRQTALTTPQIWSKIHYQAYHGDLTPKMFEGLTWWFSLTSGRRVPMDFDIATSSKFPSMEVLESLIAMIIDRVHDWRALVLHEHENRELRPLIHHNLLIKASNLEVLRLYNFPEFINVASEVEGITVNFPNLDEFHMCRSNLRVLPTILAPKVVTLDLYKCAISYKDLSDMTANLPTLQHLSISGVPYHYHSLPPLEEIQYFFPCLKSMEFDTCPKIPQVFFERLCLDAPQLEDLHLIGSKIELDDVPSISQFTFRTFFNRSENDFSHFDQWGYIVSRSPNLHTLETSFASVSEFPDELPESLITLTLRLDRLLSDDDDEIYISRVVNLLWETTELEHLTLEWEQDRVNGEDFSFVPFLDALSEYLFDDGPVLCPKLQHLELLYFGVGQVAASDVLEVSRFRTQELEHVLQKTEDSDDLSRSREFLVTITGCGGLPYVEKATYAALQMYLDLYAMGLLLEDD